MKKCSLCRFKFLREFLKGNYETKFQRIWLIDAKTDERLAFIRFSEEKNKITIEFVFSHHERRGYGCRLVRAVQAIGKASNKPVIAEAIPKAVGFFKRNGFIYKSRAAGLFVLEWRADLKQKESSILEGIVK